VSSWLAFYSKRTHSVVLDLLMHKHKRHAIQKVSDEAYVVSNLMKVSDVANVVSNLIKVSDEAYVVRS